MAKTLLNGVNDLLTRAGILDGVTGQLTTLTDSAKQNYIDVAVQVWNEAVEDLYESAGQPFPQEQAESTITLSTGTQSYSLAADLVQLRWPLIDKTNTQFIHPFPGGYNEILKFDPEQDDTGLPLYAAISPVDGTLYLDRSAASSENGNVYTYQYDKDISMSAYTDTFPCTDVVYRALISGAHQLWSREQKRSYDEGVYRRSLARAARYLPQTQRPKRWLRY